jgi:hypothetical protein
MPTIYRSFNRLISAKKITHIGGERSGLYAITAERYLAAFIGL